MNDPHVKALHYTVKHGPHVDYSKAPPFEREESDFKIRIEGLHAEITMKSHFASLEEARAAIEPFLRAWSLDMALTYGPRALSSTTSGARSSTANPPPAFMCWSRSQPVSRCRSANPD